MENNYILFYSILCSVSLLVSILFLRFFIAFSKKRKLLDIPDDRKIHSSPTPSSGGLVFALLMIPILMIVTKPGYQHMICSALFLLAVGFFDDRYDLSARLKFAFQIIVAILIIPSVGTIDLFDGELLWMNDIITLFFIVGFTNAFNLMDGVDGLAGLYAVQILATITFFFMLCQNAQGLLISTVLVGGIIGFLRYNWNPARVFMGDTGSLFLGFIISTLTLVIINDERLNQLLSKENNTLILLFLSGLFLPMIDTIRVMTNRILKKKSPFKADRTHLHHLLGKIGLKPIGISLFFIGLTALFIGQSAFLIHFQFGGLFILLSLFSLALVIFNLILYLRIRQHQSRIYHFQNSLDRITNQNHLILRKSNSFNSTSAQ